MKTEVKENETIQIAPSILAADFSKMGAEVKSLEESGADIIHCDVMDGVFVNNISFGIKMVEDLRKITLLPLDCHLMIVHPEKYVERFVKAGADYVTIHAEACGETLEETLKTIRKAGAKCGAVINPDTPVSAIEKVIPLCDMVLVMSVFPGFGGQKFIADVLEKVTEIRKIVTEKGLHCHVEIDGGINNETVVLAKQAGANVIVAGSSVFKAANRAEAIKQLREA